VVSSLFLNAITLSLIATIKTTRKDLLSHIKVDGKCIPIEMPQRFQHPIDFIEDIGEPITACFLTKSHLDPTGWFVSSFECSKRDLFFFLTLKNEGGCLRNMMEFADFGTLISKPCSLEVGNHFCFLLSSFHLFLTFFLMENYGLFFFSFFCKISLSHHK
jgi:hypothetical protein